MSKVLSEAGLPSDAAFTIREHFTVTPGAKSLAEVSVYRPSPLSSSNSSSLLKPSYCVGGIIVTLMNN